MPEQEESSKPKHHTFTKAMAAIGAGALLLHGARFALKVFGPTRPYRLQENELATDSPEFLNRLACITDALLCRNARISVLKNGPEFYPAELAAIDSAEKCINLEAYEFLEGDLTREIVNRLAARARQGVQVRLVIDAIGSFGTKKSYFQPLLSAGGHVAWYHRIDWREWPAFDHRTHRKLLIVDGKLGFVGGADYADHWIENENGKLPWRDTVLRVEGGVVGSLNATFAENWIDATGEILFNSSQFPPDHAAGDKACMVIMSTPGYGTSRSRVLFQTLLESAQSTIQITSPYFLPDRSVRQALTRAIRERGVKVQVLTAGGNTDYSSVRRLSEALSTSLIRDGVEFYEYEPSMIHAKLMTIDGVWTVAGSTNFDHRSFALNDEVNLAVFDRETTGCIEGHFKEDLEQSQRITLKQLRSDGWGERLFADASWVFRQEE